MSRRAWQQQIAGGWGGTYLFEVRSSSLGGRRLGLGGEAGGGALAGAIEAEHGQALGEGVAQPRRPPLAPAHPPILHPRHPARSDGGWIHRGGGGMRRRRHAAAARGSANPRVCEMGNGNTK